MDCQHWFKEAGPCRECLLKEVERLKDESLKLAKAISFIDPKVKNLREALEIHKPPTCREHDACKSIYDDKALKEVKP